MVVAHDPGRQALRALLPERARAFDVVGLGEGSVDRRVEVDRVPRPGQKVGAQGLLPNTERVEAFLAAVR